MVQFKADPSITKKKEFVGPPAPSNTQTAQNKPNSLNAQSAAPGGIGSQAAGTPVRSTLTNLGLDNRKIGWNANTNMVTYNGKDYLKPSNVADGVSYADDASIRKAAASMFQDSGNPLASATDYFSNAGISNAVQFTGDGMISIGGQTVKPTFITDTGKAVLPTDQLNALLAGYKDRTGIKSHQDIYDAYEDKYGGKIKNALNDILDREQWSYSAEDDPAYRAYRDAYTREGNRALQDAVGGMASMTGGYTSSAAATAGLQAQNYYMQQLGDRIPELMANDYARYMGEQQLRHQALDAIRNVYNDDYSKAYQANRDTINDITAANNASWERDMYNKQWNDTHALNAEQIKQAQIQNEYLPTQLKQEVDYNNNRLYQQGIDNEYYRDNAIADLAARQLANNGQELTNKGAELELALAAAQTRGWFTDEEAARFGLVKDANGNYPSPFNNEILHWKDVEKPQYDYQLAASARYSSGGSSRSRSGGSSGRSGGSNKQADISAVDTIWSDFMYSTDGLDGNELYSGISGKSPQEIAAMKIKDRAVVDQVKEDFIKAGATAKVANGYIKQYKQDIAIELAKSKGLDYTDTDDLNKIRREYGL